MALPTYKEIKKHLLEFLSDEELHTPRESYSYIASSFNLSEEEKGQLLPSGTEPIINNRVRWAKMFLSNADLLESPSTGRWKITSKGLALLKESPDKIYLAAENLRNDEVLKNDQISETEEEKTFDNTPDELLEKGYNAIKLNLREEILQRLIKNTPNFFENVVLELLSAMGYGKGEVTGRPGDGGIDGFVNQDKLGLDRIYFQAKRFNENNQVAASMIRDFVGTLELKGANKGVFITTSGFPRTANDTVSSINKNVVLVDGKELVNLMIEHNVGVQTEKTYEIKKIDNDFFIED